uniref:Uncharacterized protein n=1 Tax=Hyaloperonospora arabidopsidis (strain Emoy2) TaxID=559515 RepID=M4C1X7_HYAAE
MQRVSLVFAEGSMLGIHSTCRSILLPLRCYGTISFVSESRPLRIEKSLEASRQVRIVVK